MRKSAATHAAGAVVAFNPSLFAGCINCKRAGIQSAGCCYVTRVRDINRIKKVLCLGVSPWRRTCVCAALRNFPQFTPWAAAPSPPLAGWLPGCSLFQFTAETSKALVGAAFRLCCSLLAQEFLARGFCATWMGPALGLSISESDSYFDTQIIFSHLRAVCMPSVCRQQMASLYMTYLHSYPITAVCERQKSFSQGLISLFGKRT